MGSFKECETFKEQSLGRLYWEVSGNIELLASFEELLLFSWYCNFETHYPYGCFFFLRKKKTFRFDLWQCQCALLFMLMCLGDFVKFELHCLSSCVSHLFWVLMAKPEKHEKENKFWITIIVFYSYILNDFTENISKICVTIADYQKNGYYEKQLLQIWIILVTVFLVTSVHWFYNISLQKESDLNFVYFVFNELSNWTVEYTTNFSYKKLLFKFFIILVLIYLKFALEIVPS